MPVVLARIIVALLILRTAAAPVALRSGAQPSPRHYSPVLRVCAWPAQRLRLASDPAESVKIRPGPGLGDLLPSTGPPPVGAAGPRRPSGPGPESAWGRYSRRATSHLRC